MPDSGSEESSQGFHDAEILDEMTTNRGEVKLITVSWSDERLFQVKYQKSLYVIINIVSCIYKLENGIVYRSAQMMSECNESCACNNES